MNTYPVSNDVKEQVLHESTTIRAAANDFDYIGTKQIAIIPKNDNSYRKVARNVFQSLHNLSHSSSKKKRLVKALAMSSNSTTTNETDVENAEKGFKPHADHKTDSREVKICDVHSPIQVTIDRHSLERSNVAKLQRKRKVEVVTEEESSKKTCYGRSSKQMNSFFHEVSRITLEDERVFDSCDEVRMKISNFIEQHGSCRKALISNFHVHGITFNTFMKSSKQEQCHSIAYKNAYIFFEKLRIYQGMKKSGSRLKNEMLFPYGFSLQKKTPSEASTSVATGEMC